MVFSEYVKLRILYHFNNGLKPYTIVRVLSEEEGIRVSKVGVWKFLKVYRSTGTTTRRPGSGRMSKITQQVKELVDRQMEKDDETTATQLHKMLNENGIDISLRTVLRLVSYAQYYYIKQCMCVTIGEKLSKLPLYVHVDAGQVLDGPSGEVRIAR